MQFAVEHEKGDGMKGDDEEETHYAITFIVIQELLPLLHLGEKHYSRSRRFSLVCLLRPNRGKSIFHSCAGLREWHRKKEE